MLEDNIKKIVDEYLADKDIMLVELKYESRSKMDLLKIFIDTEAGVTIDECKKVSREVDDIFYSEDTIPGSYRIEVSSPGADRQLKNAWEFKRHVSRKLKVEYAHEGKTKVIEGILEEVNENSMLINLGKEKLDVEFENLVYGQVVLPW